MRKNQYEAHKLFYEGLMLLSNPKKVDKAIKKIEKSYKLGSPLALYEIAIILRRKDLKDYPQDLEKSDEYLKKARPILEANIEGGLDSDLARHFLASYYLNGYVGVEIDEAYGLSLEEKCAKNGLVEATEFLISYYSNPDHNNLEKVEFYKQLLEEQKAILARGETSGVIDMLQEDENNLGENKTVADMLDSEEETVASSESIASTSENLELEKVEESSSESGEVEMEETLESKETEDESVLEAEDIQEEVIEESSEASDEEVQEEVYEPQTVDVYEGDSSMYDSQLIEVAHEIDYHDSDLPLQGKAPKGDWRRLYCDVDSRSQEKAIELKIVDHQDEEEYKDCFDLAAAIKALPAIKFIDFSDVYKPRQQYVFVDPEYSEEELTPEYKAKQKILKALRTLEQEKKEGLEKALPLLKEASSVYPAVVYSIMGDIYFNEEYTSKDVLLAMHYYKNADDLESVYASYMLGTIYLSGEEDISDRDLGIRFIRKAATKGYGPALDRMGQLYHNGEISYVSYQAAYGFYQLAVDRGYKNSYLSMAKIDEARGDSLLAEEHMRAFNS